MRIRLRGPNGVSTLNLENDATVGELRAQIKEKTLLIKYDIKFDYPPKPLQLGQDSTLLSELDVQLDGKQLIVSSQDALVVEKPAGCNVSATQSATSIGAATPSKPGSQSQPSSAFSFAGMPSADINSFTEPSKDKSHQIPLKRKTMEGEVPEIPLPDRGATLVMRVMPDDNSCLFRAFGTAVLPGDDLSMPELRSLVASTIQQNPDTFTKVVLEQDPDDYCRWIQTEDAWGGAIEMGILASHFDIEICSMDVQSLRIDRFNEGRPTRCILVYSGIHYDTIVQSPSDPPHTKSDSPPDFDKRIWDADDDDILNKAKELGKKLQAKHYFTDTGGMAIKCNECGWVGYGEGQASGHAMQLNHYDMAEVQK